MVVSITSFLRTPELPAIWNFAPDDRSPDYFRQFSAVSLAVQRCLRERVPPVFLAVAIFERPSLVYPVLMYAASRPFRPRFPHEFAYDPIDVSWFVRFVKASKRGLSPQLRDVYDRMDREQAGKLSRPYGPRRVARAIRIVRKFKRSQTLLSNLVAGEAALVDDLLRLAGLGQLPERDRKKVTARFFRDFHLHLRHMCNLCDLRPLAPALVAAATQALALALAAPVAA